MLLILTLCEQIKFSKEQKRLAFDDQFKSTLFNMLETQRELRNKVARSLKGSEESTSLFSMTINDLYYIYEVLNYEKFCSEEDVGHCRHLYQTSANFNISRELYDDYQNISQQSQKVALGIAIYYDKHEDLVMYFRYLYYVLKFIDDARTEEVRTFYKGKEPEKVQNKYEEYIHFFQTQLFIDELLLLFYTSFIIVGLQDLLIRYKFLAFLDVERLLSPSHNCVGEMSLNRNKNMFAQIIKKPVGYVL